MSAELLTQPWDVPAERTAPIEPTAPLLVDQPTAAQMLSVSIRTLQRLRADGLLPFVMVCGAVRYDVLDLGRFIRANKSNCHQGFIT